MNGEMLGVLTIIRVMSSVHAQHAACQKSETHSALRAPTRRSLLTDIVAEGDVLLGAGNPLKQALQVRHDRPQERLHLRLSLGGGAPVPTQAAVKGVNACRLQQRRCSATYEVAQRLVAQGEAEGGRRIQDGLQRLVARLVQGHKERLSRDPPLPAMSGLVKRSSVVRALAHLDAVCWHQGVGQGHKKLAQRERNLGGWGRERERTRPGQSALRPFPPAFGVRGLRRYLARRLEERRERFQRALLDAVVREQLGSVGEHVDRDARLQRRHAVRPILREREKKSERRASETGVGVSLGRANAGSRYAE